MKKQTFKSRLRIKQLNERKRRTTSNKRVFSRFTRLHSIESKQDLIWMQEKQKKGLVKLHFYRTRKNVIDLYLPEKMNFSDQYDQTVSALSCIRRISDGIRRNKPTGLCYRLGSVNFDKLSEISTSAALVLAAEICYWDDSANSSLTSADDRWHPAIKKQFSELGFFELFGISHEVECEVCDYPLQSIKYHRGRGMNAGLAAELRRQLENVTGSQISTQLYSGLSEAMYNVIGHAYPDEVDNGKKSWFMTGSYNRDTRELKVAFYDQGIGIPESLKRATFFEKAKKLFDYKDHSSIINAAFEIGRTQTDRPERGKGLNDLLQLIKDRENGYLSVISLKGLYKYTKETGTASLKAEDFNYPVEGTLITWSFTLGE